jgi:O-antigen ligase
MIISCFYSTLFNSFEYTEYWDHKLSWIGLLNWLPFFWFFWALQPFLLLPKDREQFAKILLAGSIPVLISCFIHYFLGWNGPYSIFNGLVVWFQKPILPNEGVTGLFNNPNYTGSWLNIIWPFLLASFLKKSNNNYSRIFIFLLIIFSSIALFLTLSRNAWLGYSISLILTLLTLFKFSEIKKSFIFFLPIPIALLIYFLSDLNLSILDFFINKFNREFSSEYYTTLEITRINIWLMAIKYILEKPFLGWGAASFPVLLSINSDIWKGHTHNLFLEIGISYGLPAQALISVFVFFILFRSCKNIFKNHEYKNRFTNKILFENAWLFSSTILIISQLFDVQYYDGRISIIFWILLAGLKNNIVQEDLKINLKS